MAISPEANPGAHDDTERTDVAEETDDEILLEHLAVYLTQYSTIAHYRACTWMLNDVDFTRCFTSLLTGLELNYCSC